MNLSFLIDPFIYNLIMKLNVLRSFILVLSKILVLFSPKKYQYNL